MKIQCDCSKTMEDAGEKIEIETSIYTYDDNAKNRGAAGYLLEIFSLFNCTYCGSRVIVKQITETEYEDMRTE